MENPQTWYIVKRQQGHCEIVTDNPQTQQETPDILERWGPFNDANEALARRVGLIRSGKCQPQ